MGNINSSKRTIIRKALYPSIYWIAKFRDILRTKPNHISIKNTSPLLAPNMPYDSFHDTSLSTFKQ